MQSNQRSRTTCAATTLLSRHFSLHVQYICSTCVWSTLVILNAPDISKDNLHQSNTFRPNLHKTAFGVSSKDFYFEEGFCLSTQKSRCSSKLCNSRSFLADFGKLLYSVITSHDLPTPFQLVYIFYGVNILVIFQPAEMERCRWWGRIFLMILKPQELFRRLMKDVFPFHPEIWFKNWTWVLDFEGAGFV